MRVKARDRRELRVVGRELWDGPDLMCSQRFMVWFLSGNHFGEGSLPRPAKPGEYPN